MAIGNESSGAFAIGGWRQFILFEHRRILDRREGQGARPPRPPVRDVQRLDRSEAFDGFHGDPAYGGDLHRVGSGAIFPSGTVSLGAPPQRIEVARIYNALVSPKGLLTEEE